MFGSVHIKPMNPALVKLLRTILAVATLCFWGQHVAAKCTFPTAAYTQEMQLLKSVTNIEVVANKYRKWIINAATLAIDGKPAIANKYKKKFKAKVTVHYPFGSCRYKAKIRQNGDWTDHILWDGGFLQSLDIKLEDGNIANVVRFKLLLPNTRNSQNEIFATMLLRHLDLIAPRTTLMNATVNGRRHIYLFQEKQSKELLEGMGRREGPMFEGDENLSWGDGYRILAELYSASRLVNRKWAARGASSIQMSLKAFMKVQRQYLFSISSARNPAFVDRGLSNGDYDPFISFHAMIYAMNGSHALIGHNRKFYWNALREVVEPVYYDGNIRFGRLLAENKTSDFWKHRQQQIHLKELRALNFKQLIRKVESFVTQESTRDLADAAKLAPDAAQKVIDVRIAAIVDNLWMLERWSKDLLPLEPTPDFSAARIQFVNQTLETQHSQIILAPVTGQLDAKNGLAVECLTPDRCPSETLDIEELALLMSENRIGSKRAVLVDKLDGNSNLSEGEVTRVLSLEVRHSKGAKVSSVPNGRILLQQRHAKDWFFIKSVNLGDIGIDLVGVTPLSNESRARQRFNAMGLTGCLTLFDVVLNGNSIAVSDGGCEDSLNIVSSRGTLRDISIERSFADAIDIDFSEVEIERIFVRGAGNDCLDVSGGDYTVVFAELKHCADKGISAGEASRFNAERVKVTSAEIGASSKDYSTLSIKSFIVHDTTTCIEAFQKKMEFGGGTFWADKISCSEGKIRRDKDSRIQIGGEPFEFSN